jgi:Arm DNA-binding domain
MWVLMLLCIHQRPQMSRNFQKNWGHIWGQIFSAPKEMPPMPLTDTACKNAKPTDKARKMADGHGLYLEVMPSGARYWRLKYRFMEKEKRLALGVYPDVTLGQARQKGEAPASY